MLKYKFRAILLFPAKDEVIVIMVAIIVSPNIIHINAPSKENSDGSEFRKEIMYLVK